jgi:hypothetical protein
MEKRHRNWLIAGAVALALIAVAGRPHAGIAIAMERAGDLSPQRVHAAVDLGVVAFSVLITWSKRIVA